MLGDTLSLSSCNGKAHLQSAYRWNVSAGEPRICISDGLCHFKYTNCPNIHIRILIYILRIVKDGIFDDRQEWSMKSFNYEEMQTTGENGMSETESEDFRFSIFDGSPSDDSPYAKYIEQGDYHGDHGQDLFSEDD